MPEDNILAPAPINTDPAPESKGGKLLKGRLPIFLAIGGTVILAGIAVFTAVRLYQLRQESVTPTTPQEEAQAQLPSPTPTPKPTSSPTPGGSVTPTRAVSPTLTPRLSPTASVSATPTTRATATPTQAGLPDAGVSFPTVVGVSAGIMLLVVSILLAL
jgi:cytoskeletal protein RodZ